MNETHLDAPRREPEEAPSGAPPPTPASKTQSVLSFLAVVLTVVVGVIVGGLTVLLACFVSQSVDDFWKALLDLAIASAGVALIALDSTGTYALRGVTKFRALGGVVALLSLASAVAFTLKTPSKDSWWGVEQQFLVAFLGLAIFCFALPPLWRKLKKNLAEQYEKGRARTSA